LLLSQPDIIREIENGRLRFAPEIPKDRIGQVSVDLLLGRKFTTFKIGASSSIELDPSTIWESGPDIWKDEESDSFVLEPGKLVLAQTLETVCLPNDLAGLVEGRSTYARLGIGVHVTAPKIDPGFQGTITLEMANHGPLPIKLRAGSHKPAQLMLFRLSTPLEESQLYGAAAEDVFQYQNTPVPPRR